MLNKRSTQNATLNFLYDQVLNLTCLLLVLFIACSAPGEPEMGIERSARSLSVVVRKPLGRFAVLKYCMMIVGKDKTTCHKENSPYHKSKKQEATTTFSSLNPYTNYTVQGWIINTVNDVGSKRTRVVQTLPDSKFADT